MTDSHAQRELAERYAGDLLTPAEAALFELHLVLCEQCQTEVRLAAGVRRLVRDAPSAAPSRRGRWIGGVSVLLAASVAAVLLSPRRVDRDVAALGQVREPPAYLGMRVRAMPLRGDSLFNVAMAAYLARRYEVASSSLRSALSAGVDTVTAEFFLASAELFAGHPREAAAEYGRVIAAGRVATVYLPEAHFYRAHAFLQLGNSAEALSELHAVPPTDRMTAARASALAESVTKVLRR